MDEQPWVDGLTFGQALARTAERFGEREALVFPFANCRLTYRRFREEVRRVAGALLSLGVERGEHLGIWATNWPQWVLVQFASAEIGAVLVNINPAYRASELEYVLGQAEITTLFLTDRFKSSNYFDLLRSVCPEIDNGSPKSFLSAKCPRLRRVISIHAEHPAGAYSWHKFLEQDARDDAALDRRASAVKSEYTVNIQYTSGTTGFPKGAMLTHRNLLMNAYHVGRRLGFSEDDRLCLPVPLYHCFGCVMGSLMCAVNGATLVGPAESFDALATLETVKAERCTALYGVPTMFIAQLHHARFDELRVDTLRTGIMAGSPCPIEIMRAVTERMGIRGLTIAYGLTEASPVITQTSTNDSLEHRVSTVGTVIPGLEVRLVRPGTMEDATAGESGELIVHGHGVMKGYFNKPAETAQALTPDGWLHTGDLAQRMPDGYYRITGRIKDMIIRGGENVYPREIEEFLHTHPSIADVQVVGLPDVRYVEEISAWIRLKPGATLTEDGVKSFCKSRIAHYKVPRYVVFVDEYPTTVTGKVQKFKLREMGVSRFGLDGAARVETA